MVQIDQRPPVLLVLKAQIRPSHHGVDLWLEEQGISESDYYLCPPERRKTDHTISEIGKKKIGKGDDSKEMPPASEPGV